MGKRARPTLPRLKCLDERQVDADDAKAGAIVAATHVELIEALDETHWRAKRARQEETPERRRRKPAESAPGVNPEAPAELLVPIEAPAPTWSPEPPAVALRARSMPPPHRRIPKTARLVTIDIADPDDHGAAAQVVAPPPRSTVNGHGLHREYQAPPRRTVRVAARADLLNLMHARGQLDDASFNAGRA